MNKLLNFSHHTAIDLIGQLVRTQIFVQACNSKHSEWNYIKRDGFFFYVSMMHKVHSLLEEQCKGGEYRGNHVFNWIQAAPSFPNGKEMAHLVSSTLPTLGHISLVILHINAWEINSGYV